MIKVLVAVAFYPDDKGNKPLFYAHVRNVYYSKKGIDVTVLNFATNHDYVLDGINVISLKSYKSLKNQYDILISHAANIRNQYMFLKFYGRYFPKKIFFFHGHEIMRLSKYYPEPYSFVKNASQLKRKMRDVYDSFKLKLWHDYFLSKDGNDNVQLVFVSSWMRDVFFTETGISKDKLRSNTHVIANSVGLPFEENTFDYSSPKKYDFVTIRNNLDGSKYCIDIVIREALNNPNYKFCIVGKGDFFKYNKVPNNVKWISHALDHSEILNVLNQSKCALMPTRTDAQGVMTCEMATFGIPVITSNIEICREVFKGFDNVALGNNEDMELKLNYQKLMSNGPYERNSEYTQKNTVNKEVKLIKSIMGESK